jgi:hypothetical protein
MIVDLADILSFLDATEGFFTITATNDIIKLKYDGGATTDIEADDSTYEGDDLASHLQGKIVTAFGSGTVTYDSTTRKFTISVVSPLTIEYVHLGSDMGLTLGFNADHLAAQTITSNVAASDPSKIISSIHGSVEDWVENHCYRKFEDALYVKERHDGKDQNIIYFEQYPVLAVNLDGLVWDASAKTVTRSDGGSFITDGFEAADKVLVQNSDSNSGLLTVSTVAANVLTFSTETITADTSDDNVILSLFRELWINDTEIDEDDFEVFADHIYYNAGFSEGHGNIRMTYYIKYSIIDINDLELAIKIIAKSIYQTRQEEIFGVKNYKVGDVSITCDSGDVPKEALSILDKYRKVFIV